MTDKQDRTPSYERLRALRSWPVGSVVFAAILTAWMVVSLWLSGDSITWWQAALCFVGFFLLFLAYPRLRRFFNGPNREQG